MLRFRPRTWVIVLLALLLSGTVQAQDRNFWAVIIGVSKFANFKPNEQLEFADKDAETFAKFIRSPRGRAFPEANIKLLLNEAATVGAVRRSLATWLPRNSKPNDIVYIFIATHGMVEKDAAKFAFLVTNDADPEDLYTTSLPMKELADIVSERLGKAGRIVLFTDACRSGKLGEQQKGIHRQVENAANKNAELIGLMASRPNEFSQEGKQFGGGHGAFTYFLLKGLEGAADKDKDNIVSVSELIGFMTDQVPKNTNDQQHIREFGNFDNDVPLSYVDKPGADIKLTDGGFWPRLNGLWASLRIPVLQNDDLKRSFDQAVQERRLISPSTPNAWDLLQQLTQAPLPAAVKEDARDTLAIALENEAQKVLVAYLKGDASPLSASQYRFGGQLFARASDLSPEVAKLKAKARFCDGRALLLENKFRDAQPILREAISIDDDGAYSHNALGIAYLNEKRYQEALGRFRDAVERAPKWAYPHYNMALAYTQMRNFPDAEKAYKAALERGPNYAYLHHNLGLLYYMMQDRKGDAERELRRAIQLKPDDAGAYNLLGGLLQDKGDLGAAETQFRQAIRLNASNPDYRRNLAKVLLDRGNKKEAERVLEEALQVDPRYADAYRALGMLLMERGALKEAEERFMILLQLAPPEASVFILLGDVNTELKKLEDAAGYYRQAQQLTTDAQTLREIEKKLRKVAR